MNAEAKRLNDLTDKIIGAAIEVHRALGPGLLESAYEACLYHELVKARVRVERQKPLPLVYDEIQIGCSYRMDLVVEGAVIVEVKSVAKVERVHEAQMISYLKISGLRVGLIINFNVRNVSHDGITRRVNDFPED
jgi:GxxExxY protein